MRTLGKIRLEDSGALCYAFAENLAAPEMYDERLEVRFREIIADFRPDMVHIFAFFTNSPINPAQPAFPVAIRQAQRFSNNRKHNIA